MRLSVNSSGKGYNNTLPASILVLVLHPFYMPLTTQTPATATGRPRPRGSIGGGGFSMTDSAVFGSAAASFRRA